MSLWNIYIEMEFYENLGMEALLQTLAATFLAISASRFHQIIVH